MRCFVCGTGLMFAGSEFHAIPFGADKRIICGECYDDGRELMEEAI